MNRDAHTEATPDGIRFGHFLTGYRAAIRQLDGGQSDDDLPAGFRIIAAVWDGVAAGYFTPTDEQKAVLWRWIVSALFIIEQRQTNGTVGVENEDGGTDRATIYQGEHGGISVYPSSERCSLANHIEGLALEKYGAERGYPMAVNIYQTMVESVPGEGLRLSNEGRKGLAMLHDGFIEMLNTEGVPDAPVTH